MNTEPAIACLIAVAVLGRPRPVDSDTDRAKPSAFVKEWR